MDDDLEDEVFYQTLVSHGKIFSRFIVSIPIHASLSNITRYAKFYFSKPECIILLIITILILAVFNNLDYVLKSASERYQYVGSSYNFVTNLSFRSSQSNKPSSDVTDGRFSSVFNRAQNVNDEIGPNVTWEKKSENYAVYSVKGRRPHMEDRFSVYKHELFSIYGIFDGHGGQTAAEYAKKYLLKNIADRILKIYELGDEYSTNFSTILTEEILSLDHQLLKELKEKKDIGGTTLVVALVIQKSLIVANVGDSRGIMCDKSNVMIPLTFDHKPQQPKERNRIQNAGGFVSFNGVWRVAGILATSRAIGDYPLKDKQFLIAEPDILTFKMDKIRPKYIILATDGLWDNFKNEEVVTFINKISRDDSHYGAHSLVKQSYNRGSLDNITVMIVRLED